VTGMRPGLAAALTGKLEPRDIPVSWLAT